MLTALYNAIDKQSCTLNVTFKHNRNYINYTHSIKISLPIGTLHPRPFPPIVYLGLAFHHSDGNSSEGARLKTIATPSSYA